MEVRSGVFADDLGQPTLQVAALDPEKIPSVTGQGEGDVRPGDRHTGHDITHVTGLGLGAFHELEPRRCVEEYLLDADGRAGRHAAGLDIPHPAPLYDHLGPFRVIRLTRGQAKSGYRGDGGERLTPETEGEDALQVVVGLYLAGGVAFQ